MIQTLQHRSELTQTEAHSAFGTPEREGGEFNRAPPLTQREFPGSLLRNYSGRGYFSHH